MAKYFNTVEDPKYVLVQPASPKLGLFKEHLIKWIEEVA